MSEAAPTQSWGFIGIPGRGVLAPQKLSRERGHIVGNDRRKAIKTLVMSEQPVHVILGYLDLNAEAVSSIAGVRWMEAREQPVSASVKVVSS
jgi:hypothetical protein